jgi:uncharacterized protein YvpB
MEMQDKITVRELITRLQQIVNQDKPVTIWIDEYGNSDWLQDWDDRDDEFVLMS